MNEKQHPGPGFRTSSPSTPQVKLVAAMPDQDPTGEDLQEMKARDGYAGSCGIPNRGKKEAPR